MPTEEAGKAEVTCRLEDGTEIKSLEDLNVHIENDGTYE